MGSATVLRCCEALDRRPHQFSLYNETAVEVATEWQFSLFVVILLVSLKRTGRGIFQGETKLPASDRDQQDSGSLLARKKLPTLPTCYSSFFVIFCALATAVIDRCFLSRHFIRDDRIASRSLTEVGKRQKARVTSSSFYARFLRSEPAAKLTGINGPLARNS